MKPAFMTSEDISNEIFGGNRSARVINERDSMHPDYPKPRREGKTGQKFFKRHEIYKYYDIELAA